MAPLEGTGVLVMEVYVWVVDADYARHPGAWNIKGQKRNSFYLFSSSKKKKVIRESKKIQIKYDEFVLDVSLRIKSNLRTASPAVYLKH